MLVKCLFIVVATNLLLAGALPIDLVIVPTPEVIESYGFPSETHHVTTSDGYILEMHRIPHGREGPTPGRRPPVLILHGLLGASSHFLALGAEKSIAFNLADAGFDVWLGNARGNRDSRRHISLDPDSEEDKFEFWNFSWEEIGLYDIPSMTEYVKENTGFSKIHYMGHSQGTTAFFVLNAMRPEYNDNFATAHLLTPVSLSRHFPTPLMKAVSVFTDVIYRAALRNGLMEIGQNVLNAIGIETNGVIQSEFYKKIMTELGFMNKNIEIPNSIVNLFGGMSIKQLAHYGQNIRSGSFERWHFGLLENRRVYGTLRPPAYDISHVSVPTYLHYTVADILSGVEDVLEMERVMPHAIARKIAADDYDHEGVIFDTRTKELITDFIIDQLHSVDIN